MYTLDTVAQHRPSHSTCCLAPSTSLIPLPLFVVLKATYTNNKGAQPQLLQPSSLIPTWHTHERSRKNDLVGFQGRMITQVFFFFKKSFEHFLGYSRISAEGQVSRIGENFSPLQRQGWGNCWRLGVGNKGVLPTLAQADCHPKIVRK